MNASVLKPDILILGGGIAGLWLVNQLQSRGFQCLLLETGDLGGGQTLASQGIIHGGLKYALGGALSSESESIAGMPERWREAMAGQGPVDLGGLRVLSPTQHLWSAGSVASRMTTFFASRMVRGRIEKLQRAHYPSALANPRFKGQVYSLDDLVVDTESLLELLSAPVRERLLHLDLAQDRLIWGESGLDAVELAGRRIEPRLTVLAAGEGNAELLAAAHKAHLFPKESSQSRPLKMVLVKHPLGHRLYAHCVGTSNKPRLTVTTHDLPDGDLLWYLGGDLAERGAERDDAAQISAARRELDALFPWLDFSAAELAVLEVARAEPRQQALAKPDTAYARRDRDLILTWPTKLTLAPDLGERVDALVDQHGFVPGPPLGSLAGLPLAPLGRSPWHSLFASAERDATGGPR